MPSYKVSDTLLNKIYTDDEKKTISHHQAQLIMRVLCASQDKALEYDKLRDFISSHPALVAMLKSTQEINIPLRYHLRKLVQAGFLVATE